MLVPAVGGAVGRAPSHLVWICDEGARWCVIGPPATRPRRRLRLAPPPRVSQALCSLDAPRWPREGVSLIQHWSMRGGKAAGNAHVVVRPGNAERPPGREGARQVRIARADASLAPWQALSTPRVDVFENPVVGASGVEHVAHAKRGRGHASTVGAAAPPALDGTRDRGDLRPPSCAGQEHAEPSC